MTRFLATYLTVTVVMLAIDLLWLGLVARSIYQSAIGHLMAEQPNLVAAAAFYLLYPVGVVVFAVVPQAGDPGWVRTLGRGALFGLFAYATYDLTNLATLRDWPLRLALLDIAWGAVVTAVSAVAGRFAMGWTTRG